MRGMRWCTVWCAYELTRPQDGRQRVSNVLHLVMAVVMLLTVLMLVAFPAFRGLERTTKRHRAIAEADALAQAALAYRRVYGQWPLEDRAEGVSAEATAIVAGKRDTVTPWHLPLKDVVAVLRNQPWGPSSPDPNPRRMIFLELADDRIAADGTPIDPWRQPYVLVMSRVAETENRVAHLEGGLGTFVSPTSDGDVRAFVDGPEDAAAFSWGDPASTDAKPWLFSWSKR